MTKVSVTAGGFEILSIETFSMKHESIFLDCGGLLWMDSIDEQITLEVLLGNRVMRNFTVAGKGH